MHRKTKKRKGEKSTHKVLKSYPHGTVREFKMAPVYTHTTGEKISPAHKYKEYTSWGSDWTMGTTGINQVQKLYDYEVYTGRNSQED